MKSCARHTHDPKSYTNLLAAPLSKTKSQLPMASSASASAVRLVRNLNASGASTLHSASSEARSPAAASYDGTTNGRGEPHGKGRRTFTSGHVYDGQWQDGRCHGFGRFTYPDGQVFEGQWEGGRRNGEGTLSMPDGETISGTWVDDTLSGAVRRWNSRAEAATAVAPKAIVKSASAKADGAISTAAAGPAASDADAAWLRESHDVIWQLNVELQMENERLVAENRRLRLKLRSMLQTQGVGDCQNCQSNQGKSGKEKEKEPPRVVEGRLRRKKKGEKASAAADTNWIAKLLGEAGVSASSAGDIATLLPPAESGKANSDNKRRSIVEELCDRAKGELEEQLRQSGWTAIKGLDRAGEVEKYARHVLDTYLRPVRERPYREDRALVAAAAEIRDGLSAVVGWPEGLDRMLRRSNLDADSLLQASELKLDACGIGTGGAGALGVLLRASSRLKVLDVGSNHLSDVGATLLADVLRSSTSLTKLRLHDNDIGQAGGGALAAMLTTNRAIERLDLRGNRFDVLSESALRQAGGSRVVLQDKELQQAKDFLEWGGGDPAASDSVAMGGTRDADAFLAFSTSGSKEAAPPPPPPPPRPSRDANAFLAFGSRTGGGAPPVMGAPGGSNDAEAFLSFGGSGCNPPAPVSTTIGLAGGSNSAEAFLNFAGGGGSSTGLNTKPNMDATNSKARVNFAAPSGRSP